MKVRLVDGSEIRNTLDIDFGVIGHHSTDPYVKRGEIWFDRAYESEKDWSIELYLKQRRWYKKLGYEAAKARFRSQVSGGDLNQVKIELLKRENDWEIILVNGTYVREAFDPGFCFGGHWKVYDYIPANSIWIDSVANPAEREFIIIHELFELDLMLQGKSYNDAHDYANAREKEARRAAGVARYLFD